MNRPYWWHGYPWLICNLLGAFSGAAGIGHAQDGEWFHAALTFLASWAAFRYGASHREKYDELNKVQ